MRGCPLSANIGRGRYLSGHILTKTNTILPAPGRTPCFPTDCRIRRVLPPPLQVPGQGTPAGAQCCQIRPGKSAGEGPANRGILLPQGNMIVVLVHLGLQLLYEGILHCFIVAVVIDVIELVAVFLQVIQLPLVIFIKIDQLIPV